MPLSHDTKPKVNGPRIVDVFSADKQNQIRAQLSMVLACVISQALLPKLGGGLYAAIEIMVGTSAIKSLIRENKIHNIDNQIQIGTKFGMQTLNQSLAQSVKEGLISEDEALMASMDREDFKKCMMN